ncbi:hypothetical protein SODALDRAFT_92633 [Sodiomyces alkalinus F11]|uniref:DUF7598 domain-containing protein n=1 Tax=Sodiomyces alkalinus (strain CBS 110278 / VKM F-3762 / F11) TaxID=1314773 RepID=A0A3N2Q0Y5_SODAK|nr:hypothetical protein SODALDRAFT_92633 [Sodiomyces alkalinus F11]ROT40275.1 hypothetical protein SODALDRAFT_92633 [Sodiomyces alkalinus F11]
MFNLSENSRLRGSGHLILNVFRACNIISLLAVCVATWVMIIMSGLTGNFFFFEAVSHFFTFVVASFLMCSELNLFKRYFARHWPVLSPYRGLTWLGIAMIVMGCHVLGNLNRRSVTPEVMGGHFWRLVLAAGILCVTFGFFNIISSVIFRDSDNGITARNIRADGAIASPTSGAPTFNDAFSARSGSFRSNPSFRNEKGFKRLTQRFIKPSWPGAKPKIGKPMPAMDDDDDVERASNNDASIYPVPDRSPIMPDVPRPPTALHPINQRITTYSEAHHLNRF